MIEHGHSFAEIRQYTLGQLRAFTQAAERSHRRQLADAVVTARAAQYDQNDFKRYLNSLV